MGKLTASKKELLEFLRKHGLKDAKPEDGLRRCAFCSFCDAVNTEATPYCWKINLRVKRDQVCNHYDKAF